ncbi:uncharacterized protein RJT21DRAFT_899 [Scheffersomyces amazonensis]|uniref:uncharacterized protein n=1 Tax=Scheffersomyces amazonensis TaxID=1078765 RepID=UPI00315DE6D7
MSTRRYNTSDSPDFKIDQSSVDPISSNSSFPHENWPSDAQVPNFQLSPTDANTERVAPSGVPISANSNLHLSNGTNCPSLPLNDTQMSSDRLKDMVIEGLNHQPSTPTGVSSSISCTDVANTTMSYDDAAKSESNTDNLLDFQSIINSNIINKNNFDIWKEAYNDNKLNENQKKSVETYFNKSEFLKYLANNQKRIHEYNMNKLPYPLKNAFYANYICPNDVGLVFKFPEQLRINSNKEILQMIKSEIKITVQELESEIQTIETKCSLTKTKLEDATNKLKELKDSHNNLFPTHEEYKKNKESLDKEHGQNIRSLYNLIVKQYILDTLHIIFINEKYIKLPISCVDFNQLSALKQRNIKITEKVNQHNVLLDFMENHPFRREDGTTIHFSLVSNDIPVAIYLELPLNQAKWWEDILAAHFPEDVYHIIETFVPKEVEAYKIDEAFPDDSTLVRIYAIFSLNNGKTQFKHRESHLKAMKLGFVSHCRNNCYTCNRYRKSHKV